MSVEKLFVRIRDALCLAKVPYMLTGSFAGSIHGVPRATQDIDIVIAPTRPQLVALLSEFPESEYYADRETAMDALKTQGQFNLIDFATGWKVDFIIRKHRAFSLEEFERRIPMRILGVSLDVTSPEDLLIAKLEWAKLGSSERQIADAAGIVHLQGDALDISYVERWVNALSLHEQWQKVLLKD
jgi:hypothetical protein